VRPTLAAAALVLCTVPVRAQLVLFPELANGAAHLVAQWIDTSRLEALQRGVRPIPLEIDQAMRGYFSDSLLARVRYTVGSADGMTLPALAFSYGDVAALTLDDIIVFRDDHAAQTDLKLWAHELTHVEQYRRWGLQGFAAHYARNPASVESEAYRNADRFMEWYDRRVR